MSHTLKEYEELVEFLNHNNPVVRVEAHKLLCGLTAQPSSEDAKQQQKPLLNFLVKEKKAIKQLVRHLHGGNQMQTQIQKSAIKSLNNLAEHDEFVDQMLESKVVSTSIELIRSGDNIDNECREFLLMLITNLTRSDKGAKQLMLEGEQTEGLHVRRLLAWFLSPVVEAKDPNAYIAHIITNISTLPSGRKLLVNQEKTYLKELKEQLSSKNRTRRIGVLTTFRNCALEDINHKFLLASELNLYPSLIEPIVGPEKFLREDEYDGLPGEVLAMMTPTKRRDRDSEVRKLIYEIILLLGRSKASRHLLKQMQVYPVLRHAHDEEKELVEKGDEAAKELDELVHEVVPYFILDEDPDPPARSRDTKQLKAGDEEEKKKDQEEEKKKEEKKEEKKDEKKVEPKTTTEKETPKFEPPKYANEEEAWQAWEPFDMGIRDQVERPAPTAEALALAEKLKKPHVFTVIPPPAPETESKNENESKQASSSTSSSSTSSSTSSTAPSSSSAKPTEEDDLPPLEDEADFMDAMD